MIKTDGVGVSIVCCWKIPVTVGEMGKRRDNQDGDLGVECIWVGIDPGAKSIVTAVWEGESMKKYSLSNKQYHHESKMNKRAFKINKHLRGARLLKWLDATPSPKTASSVCMLAHIAHLLGSPLFPKLVDFFHLRREETVPMEGGHAQKENS